MHMVSSFRHHKGLTGLDLLRLLRNPVSQHSQRTAKTSVETCTQYRLEQRDQTDLQEPQGEITYHQRSPEALMSRTIARLDCQWSASITAEPREPHGRVDLHRGLITTVSLNQVRTMRSREIQSTRMRVSPFPGLRRLNGTETSWRCDVRLGDAQQTRSWWSV